MARSVNVTNRFQLWLDELAAKTTTLVGKAKRGDFQTIERDLNTAISFFRRLADYADENDIDLAGYKDQTRLIAQHIEQVEQELTRRRRPLGQFIINILWKAAESLDGFLYKSGVPVPVFTFLAKALSYLAAGVEGVIKRLSPPDSRLLLPAPVGPIITSQEMLTARSVKQSQPSSQHRFLSDYLQCMGECDPQVAKEVAKPEFRALVNNDPARASRLFQDFLRRPSWTSGPGGDTKPQG
jgi:hypothetical protein